MVMVKKWIAILLCCVLLAGLSMGALAEDAGAPSLKASMAAGREVTAKANFTWHDPVFLDEQTNLALRKLMEATTFTARFAKQDDDSSYASLAMQMSGADAVTVDTVAEAGTTYFVSPLLGSPMAIPAGDLNQYMTNLGAYMDRNVAAYDEEIPMGSYEEMFSQFSAYVPTEEMMVSYDAQAQAAEMLASVDASFEAYGLLDTMQAIDEWALAHIQAEPYEGTVDTHLDAAVDHTDIYPVTAEDLAALVDAVEPTLEDNETYWGLVVEYYNSTLSEYDTPVTLDEVMASMPQVFATLREAIAEIPEGMDAHLKVGYDAQDTAVLTQLVLDVPDEYDPLYLMLEWMATDIPLYAECFMGDSGVMLTVDPNAPLADGREDQGFTLTLDVVDYGETSGTISFVLSNALSVTGTTRVWDAGVSMGYKSYGTYASDAYLDIVINQVDVFRGEDVEKKLAVDVSLRSDIAAETMPIISMDMTVQTGEAQGAPFNVDDGALTFVYPGQMDTEAFDAYMTNVSASMLQTMMHVMSLLPVELVEMLMSGMYY